MDNDTLIQALSPTTQKIVKALLVLEKMDAGLTKIFEDTEERILDLWKPKK